MGLRRGLIGGELEGGFWCTGVMRVVWGFQHLRLRNLGARVSFFGLGSRTVLSVQVWNFRYCEGCWQAYKHMSVYD